MRFQHCETPETPSDSDYHQVSHNHKDLKGNHKDLKGEKSNYDQVELFGSNSFRFIVIQAAARESAVVPMGGPPSATIKMTMMLVLEMMVTAL